MARKSRKTKPNPGAFKKGHDPRRHVLTFEDRRKGGQVAWQRMMADAPWLLAWLQRKIDGTARPQTLVDYQARRRQGGSEPPAGGQPPD